MCGFTGFFGGENHRSALWKLGFPVPIRIWLKEDRYCDMLKEAFSSELAASFFHTDLLMKLLRRHKAGKGDQSRKIWTVYTFLIWYEQCFTKA
jgi:asparagine synthase (glutamine-hydrolysing)